MNQTLRTAHSLFSYRSGRYDALGYDKPMICYPLSAFKFGNL